MSQLVVWISVVHIIEPSSFLKYLKVVLHGLFVLDLYQVRFTTVTSFSTVEFHFILKTIPAP
jgi:hypothetical protein